MLGAWLHGGACGTASLPGPLSSGALPPASPSGSGMHAVLQDLRAPLRLDGPHSPSVSWHGSCRLSLCWDSCCIVLSLLYIYVHCRYQGGFQMCVSVAAVHVEGVPGGCVRGGTCRLRYTPLVVLSSGWRPEPDASRPPGGREGPPLPSPAGEHCAPPSPEAAPGPGARPLPPSIGSSSFC